MWKRLEEIFTVCALLFCAGAFVPFLVHRSEQDSDVRPQNAAIALVQKQASSQSGDPTQPNPALLACQVFIYAGVAVLLFINRQKALIYLRNTKLLWAIVAMAFLSVLWSDVPNFAFRRCLNMLATSGFGLYLACRYSPRQMLRLMGWALLIAMACSIVVVLFWPDIGIDSQLTDYAWKGVFVQKNTLGRLMALGVLVFMFLASDSKDHRRAYSFASVLCVGVIFASRSATSALAVPILLSLVWLYALSRKRSFRFVFASAIVAAIGIACSVTVLTDPSDLFALAGRDATLSGRLEIWNAVLPKIMAHPWLGYGYSSFWLGMQSQASADLWSLLHWQIPHSHNGFLDLAEELGLIGLGLFLAGLIVSMSRGLRWARYQQANIGLWPLAYFSFMFFFNLSEGSILRQDNLFWVLYVTTFVFVAIETKVLVPVPLEAPVRNAHISLDSPSYAPLNTTKESMGMRWM
jgi:O-antigen ligase